MIMKTGFVAWLCRQANYSLVFFFFFGYVLLEIFFALLQNIVIASASQLIKYQHFGSSQLFIYFCIFVDPEILSVLKYLFVLILLFADAR